jgi:hypothetical protein
MNTQTPTYTGKIIGSKISKSARNWSFAHSYEPTDPAIQDTRGGIFIIVDIPSEYESFGKGLVKIIQDTYYEKNELDALEAFDKALNIANTKIHEHANRIVTQKHETMKILNITVAILHKSVLHLSQMGDNQIHLIRKGGFNRIGNVKEGQSIETQSFQKIASGDISIGDILAFSTPSLLESVEIDRFKEIVTSCYPSVAASQIKDILHKNPSAEFAPSVLIVEVNEPESMPETAPRIQDSKQQDTQVESQSYFEDPISQKKSETKAQIARQISGVSDDELDEMEPLEDYDLPPSAFEEDFEVSHLNNAGPHPVMVFLKRAMRVIRKQILLIQRVIKGKEDISKLNKLFLVLGVGIFAFVLFNISQKSPETNPVVQTRNLYDEAYADYETGYDLAQSTGNYSEARNYYVAALEKANQAIETGTNAEEAQSLAREIQQRIDAIDKVTRISELNILADLSVLSESADAYELAQIDSGIYVFDKTNQSLYFYAFDSGVLTLETSTLFEESALLGHMITTTSDELYMYAKNGINPTFLVYNSDSKIFEEIPLAYEGTVPTLTVFGAWTDSTGNSRLYGVSPDKSAMYRFRISGGSIEEPANIINADTTQPEFANIIDFKIDTNVYFLMADGTVDKYIPSDLDETYALKAIDGTTLTNPTGFWLLDEEDTGKYIFVADELNKRILIFQKSDGTLVDNIVSENGFEDIRDITVNESTRTIYILSGNDLIAVPFS